MKSIVYATDYSENSVAALKYAQKLSDAMQARLVVTHVFGEHVVTESLLLGYIPELRRDAIREHRKLLKEFCLAHLGNKWEELGIQIVPMDSVVILEGILSVATDWHAELIIVGTKGENVLLSKILGSTTKRLIKKAPCPVLAIPPDAPIILPMTIVYATDFEEEDVYALQKVVEIAENFKAGIQVLHISSQEEFCAETQLDWFKEFVTKKVDCSNIEFKMIHSQNIFRSLKDFLEESEADLIVMLERTKGFPTSWFHSDTVMKMESYGNIPLLSFNESNQNIFHFKGKIQSV